MGDNRAFFVAGIKSQLLLPAGFKASHPPIEHGMEKSILTGKVVEKTAFAHPCPCRYGIERKVSCANLDYYILSGIDYCFSRIL
jgi:hypothetical protein